MHILTRSKKGNMEREVKNQMNQIIVRLGIITGLFVFVFLGLVLTTVTSPSADDFYVQCHKHFGVEEMKETSVFPLSRAKVLCRDGRVFAVSAGAAEDNNGR